MRRCFTNFGNPEIPQKIRENPHLLGRGLLGEEQTCHDLLIVVPHPPAGPLKLGGTVKVPEDFRGNTPSHPMGDLPGGTWLVSFFGREVSLGGSDGTENRNFGSQLAYNSFHLGRLLINQRTGGCSQLHSNLLF